MITKKFGGITLYPEDGYALKDMIIRDALGGDMEIYESLLAAANGRWRIEKVEEVYYQIFIKENRPMK